MRNINAFKCFTLQHFHIIIQNQIKQSFTLLYLSKKTDTTLWLNQSHFCHFCPIFLHRWWVKQTHNLQCDLYRCLVLSGVFVCLYRKLLNGCSNDVKHGGVWCSGACSLKTHTHTHPYPYCIPSIPTPMQPNPDTADVWRRDIRTWTEKNPPSELKNESRSQYRGNK